MYTKKIFTVKLHCFLPKCSVFAIIFSLTSQNIFRVRWVVWKFRPKHSLKGCFHFIFENFADNAIEVGSLDYLTVYYFLEITRS